MSITIHSHDKDELRKFIRETFLELVPPPKIENSHLPPAEDRLSQKNAAIFLGISVQCLILWKKKGILPFYKVKHKCYYSKKELIEMIERNRQQKSKK